MIAALPFLLLLLALLGAPLFAVIAASAMIGFTREGIDLQAIAIEFYGIAEMPILLAIPLFTFAGYLLSESNAPQRLVRLTTAIAPNETVKAAEERLLSFLVPAAQILPKHVDGRK